MIESIFHVNVNCTDFARSLEFYAKLGFKVVRDLEVVGNPEHFNEPVTHAMASHLVTVPTDAPVSQLMEIFKRGMVAIVMHGNEFQGLITRIDLLNWLRRKL